MQMNIKNIANNLNISLKSKMPAYLLACMVYLLLEVRSLLHINNLLISFIIILVIASLFYLVKSQIDKFDINITDFQWYLVFNILALVISFNKIINPFQFIGLWALIIGIIIIVLNKFVEFYINKKSLSEQKTFIFKIVFSLAMIAIIYFSQKNK